MNVSDNFRSWQSYREKRAEAISLAGILSHYTELALSSIQQGYLFALALYSWLVSAQHHTELALNSIQQAPAIYLLLLFISGL